MRNRLDPELYDGDLEWLVQGYDRDMGRTGTLSSTVAALEHGGPGASSAEVVDAMIERLDQRVFPGGAWNTDGSVRDSTVDRARRLFGRWLCLTETNRSVLLAHYSLVSDRGCHKLPQRAESLLGRFAVVALYRAYRARGEKLQRLLSALAKGDNGYVAPQRKAAERAVRAAHREWSRTLCECCGEVSAGEVVISGKRRTLCAECREDEAQRLAS